MSMQGEVWENQSPLSWTTEDKIPRIADNWNEPSRMKRSSFGVGSQGGAAAGTKTW